MIGALPTTNTGITAESQTKMAMLKKINELVAAVNKLNQQIANLADDVAELQHRP